MPKAFLTTQEISISAGDYLMCVYKIIIERTGKNMSKKYEYLHPVVLNANAKDFIFFNEDEARYFFGNTQQHAREIEAPIEFNEEIIETIRPKYLEELNKIQDIYREEERIKLESFKQRRLKQVDQYYKSRIERLEAQIEELDYDDKLLPIRRKRLSDIIDEYENRKSGITDAGLFVDNALVSITYVQVT
jgi:hypothetical protein